MEKIGLIAGNGRFPLLVLDAARARGAGVLHRRSPTRTELPAIRYGRGTARQLSQFDIGQTVVIGEAACVAVEALEGTDATIARAGRIMSTPNGSGSTLRRDLTVVKVAK